MGEINRQVWYSFTPLDAVSMNEKAKIEYGNGVLRYHFLTEPEKPVVGYLAHDVYNIQLSADIIVEGKIIKNFTGLVPVRGACYSYVRDLGNNNLGTSVSFFRISTFTPVCYARPIREEPSGASMMHIFRMPELAPDAIKYNDNIAINEFALAISGTNGVPIISGATLLTNIVTPLSFEVNGKQIYIPNTVLRLPYTDLLPNARYSLVYDDGRLYAYPYLTVGSPSGTDINFVVPADRTLIGLLSVPSSTFNLVKENDAFFNTLKKDAFYAIFKSGSSPTTIIEEAYQLNPANIISGNAFSGVVIDQNDYIDFGIFGPVGASSPGLYTDATNCVETVCYLYTSGTGVYLHGKRLPIRPTGGPVLLASFPTDARLNISKLKVQKKSHLPVFYGAYQSSNNQSINLVWLYKDYSAPYSGSVQVASGVAVDLMDVAGGMNLKGYVLAKYFSGTYSGIKLYEYDIYTRDLTEKELLKVDPSQGFNFDIASMTGTIGMEPDYQTPYVFLSSGNYVSGIYLLAYTRNNIEQSMTYLSEQFPVLKDHTLVGNFRTAEGYVLTFVSGSFNPVSNHIVILPIFKAAFCNYLSLQPYTELSNLPILPEIATPGYMAFVSGNKIYIRNHTSFVIRPDTYQPSAFIVERTSGTYKLLVNTHAGLNKADHIQFKAEDIANDAIRSYHIASGQILSDHIALNQIKSGHIDQSQILSGHIASNQIKSYHIDANQIFSGHIVPGTIAGYNLSDPLNPAPEIILGSGKRLRGEYDATASNDPNDRCQAKWGTGINGYTRIIDVQSITLSSGVNDQNLPATIISKNLRWNGTNWYLDNTSLYGYMQVIRLRGDTQRGIDYYFATPGSGARTLYKFTSFRSSVNAGIIELLLGQDKDGNNPNILELIRWADGALIDLRLKDLHSNNIRVGRAFCRADGSYTRYGGIVTSVERVTTGIYNIYLDDNYGSSFSNAKFTIAFGLTSYPPSYNYNIFPNYQVLSGSVTKIGVNMVDNTGTLVDRDIDAVIVADIYNT